MISTSNLHRSAFFSNLGGSATCPNLRWLLLGEEMSEGFNSVHGSGFCLHLPMRMISRPTLIGRHNGAAAGPSRGGTTGTASQCGTLSHWRECHRQEMREFIIWKGIALLTNLIRFLLLLKGPHQDFYFSDVPPPIYSSIFLKWFLWVYYTLNLWNL